MHACIYSLLRPAVCVPVSVCVQSHAPCRHHIHTWKWVGSIDRSKSMGRQAGRVHATLTHKQQRAIDVVLFACM